MAVCWACGVTGQRLCLRVTRTTQKYYESWAFEKRETKNRCAFCFQIIFSRQPIHHEITILTHPTVRVFFIITPLLSCYAVNDTDCVLTLIGVSRGRRHAPVGAPINEWVTTVTSQSWTKLKPWSGDEDNLKDDLQQKITILKKV